MPPDDSDVNWDDVLDLHVVRRVGELVERRFGSPLGFTRADETLAGNATLDRLPQGVDAPPFDRTKVTAGIDTACVGKGTCGLCRVKIVAGAEHLNPFTEEERKHLGNVYHITKVRLACRSRLTGDVTIQVVRKRK